MNDVLPVIVATAGHVDHGKTALVEALTGCNTDRLPQEKERGLSIDIGFARCILDQQTSIGIVDLPGHEDYIKNMVAGAASAKILLLVIAADEAVMPQTKEHLEVVAQLTEAKIILVITKIDLVDNEYLEGVREDGLRLLAGYGLEAEQVHFTSIKNLSGLMALREGIAELAKKTVALPDLRDFRVFVERTFIAKGHGIVVTGIPVSGKICIGDSLILNNREVRVRGIESYGKKVDESYGGLCLAINIDFADSVVGKSKVQRGNVLHHSSYAESSEYIVQFRNISEDFIYQRITKCRIHSGTFSCNASVKLFGGNELRYGAAGFGNVKLEVPSILVAGDRFLIRVSSPYGSVGGGVILSAAGAYRLSGKDECRKRLFEQAFRAVALKNNLLAEMLAGNSMVFSRATVERIGHLPADLASSVIADLTASAELIMICNNFWVLAKKLELFASQFENMLAAYHQKNKYRLGMDREYAAKLLEIPVDGLEKILKLFSIYIKIEFAGRVIASKNFKPELKEDALQLYKVVSESIEREPNFWLALGEVKEQCHVKNKDAQEVIKILLAEGKIVMFAARHIVSTAEVQRLQHLLDAAFTREQILDIQQWREISGLSRNYAVESLEYFDSINITRRVASGREKIAN